MTPEGIFITELEPGPGIRLAVKDNFDTAGVLTTYGSAVFADHVPTETAEAVKRAESCDPRGRPWLGRPDPKRGVFRIEAPAQAR